MVITVYVLQSIHDHHYYVGMTNNLTRRFQEHQTGKVRSTKSRTPFTIVYKKNFSTRNTARKHEKYLKTAAGKRFLTKQFLEQQPLERGCRFPAQLSIIFFNSRTGGRVLRQKTADRDSRRDQDKKAITRDGFLLLLKLFVF